MIKNEQSTNFIRDIIDADLKLKKNQGRVHTRFPPEPNGYLHIGHAKSICINFSIANDYPGGKCNLRFDDTNPAKEEGEYVDSIIEDVKWLGFDFEDRLFFASDYFEQFYQYAIQLIEQNKAYVDDQSAEKIKDSRGTLTKPGTKSSFRNRSIKENKKIFKLMKEGEFKDGEKVLRAKINMEHPNLNMRDPIIYRIIHANHHRTGNNWCIYPMYDWAHGLEDSIEKITHSICTLEFEDHRPLYEWFLEQLGIYKPQQIEFARLNLSYTIMSKRKLKILVDNKYVSGWDDPRMPTISGLRRRGYLPQSIREFSKKIGVSKRDGIIDISLLDHCAREDLNQKAMRIMCVLDPIKIIITNYANDEELLEADNNPEDLKAGTRMIPFSKELYIERTDFIENPPKKFFRLSIGKEVRLKYAYYITCTNIEKDKKGNISKIYCTYDKKTKGGWSNDGRKVKGTMHWVSVKHAKEAEVRLYHHLFTKENPEDGKGNFLDHINPNSKEIIKSAKIEPNMQNIKKNISYQFIRHGYYCLDKDSSNEKSIFTRTVALRDSWNKKK